MLISASCHSQRNTLPALHGGVQEQPEALSEVSLGPLIGVGAHGKVYRGCWGSLKVAVKVRRGPA